MPHSNSSTPPGTALKVVNPDRTNPPLSYDQIVYVLGATPSGVEVSLTPFGERYSSYLHHRFEVVDETTLPKPPTSKPTKGFAAWVSKQK